jgi:hypothetical protein
MDYGCKMFYNIDPNFVSNWSNPPTFDDVRVCRKNFQRRRQRLLVYPLDVLRRRLSPLLLRPPLSHGRRLQDLLDVDLERVRPNQISWPCK